MAKHASKEQTWQLCQVLGWMFNEEQSKANHPLFYRSFLHTSRSNRMGVRSVTKTIKALHRARQIAPCFTSFPHTKDKCSKSKFCLVNGSFVLAGLPSFLSDFFGRASFCRIILVGYFYSRHIFGQILICRHVTLVGFFSSVLEEFAKLQL